MNELHVSAYVIVYLQLHWYHLSARLICLNQAGYTEIDTTYNCRAITKKTAYISIRYQAQSYVSMLSFIHNLRSGSHFHIAKTRLLELIKL